MDKDMSRAERRHDLARVKHNRRGYYGGTPTENPRFAGVVAHTAAVCTCAGCGNPRRFDGERTMQERRAMQAGLVG